MVVWYLNNKFTIGYVIHRELRGEPNVTGLFEAKNGQLGFL
jgi:hypothetical protein